MKPAELKAGLTVQFRGKSADGTFEGQTDVIVIDPWSNRAQVTHTDKRGTPYEGSARHIQTATVERPARGSRPAKRFEANLFSLHAMKNPRKRRASPAQIAARKKFAAAARSGKFRHRRKRGKNPAGKSAPQGGNCKICGEQMLPQNRPGWRHVSGPDWTKCRLERIERRQKRRAGNPDRVRKDAYTKFQVAAIKGTKILFLSGIALSTSREAASNYGSLQVARKIAGQVRNVGRSLGISKVAVVTKHDTPAEIKRFLLGGA